MEQKKISLRAARVNANYTQEQAAKELNVAKKTFQNWESGLTFPNVVQALAIQELFQYPLDLIFFGLNSAESEIRTD